MNRPLCLTRQEICLNAQQTFLSATLYNHRLDNAETIRQISNPELRRKKHANSQPDLDVIEAIVFHEFSNLQDVRHCVSECDSNKLQQKTQRTLRFASHSRKKGLTLCPLM